MSKPSKRSLHLVATLGDVEIELDPSSMCRILGVHDEEAEVFYSNSWPLVENFNPQECLRHLCKSNALILKPKLIDLTLEARLILFFIQHNILPQGGHLSEPTYVNLWLVYSILMGHKINLGFLIIQHMSKVVISSRSILPYGMLLTSVFQYFGVDLDIEVDLRMSKSSDYIDNACISHLGYEFDGRHWVEKGGRAPAMVDLDFDEEAEMDIPPPLPTAPTSPHSPPPTTIVGASSTPPYWYNDLLQRIDTLNLDLRALSEEQDRQFGVINHRVGELNR